MSASIPFTTHDISQEVLSALLRNPCYYVYINEAQHENELCCGNATYDFLKEVSVLTDLFLAYYLKEYEEDSNALLFNALENYCSILANPARGVSNQEKTVLETEVLLAFRLAEKSGFCKSYKKRQGG